MTDTTSFASSIVGIARYFITIFFSKFRDIFITTSLCSVIPTTCLDWVWANWSYEVTAKHLRWQIFTSEGYTCLILKLTSSSHRAWNCFVVTTAALWQVKWCASFFFNYTKREHIGSIISTTFVLPFSRTIILKWACAAFSVRASFTISRAC
jgi:hypothetical protein